MHLLILCLCGVYGGVASSSVIVQEPVEHKASGDAQSTNAQSTRLFSLGSGGYIPIGNSGIVPVPTAYSFGSGFGFPVFGGNGGYPNLNNNFPGQQGGFPGGYPNNNNNYPGQQQGGYPGQQQGGYPGQQQGGYPGQQQGGSSCRYWCRSPNNQYYCCEGQNQQIGGGGGNVGTKQGSCPPVRPSCPPTRIFGPPQTCSNDYSCGGSDKCCFDTCLQHHTCKPAQGGFGRW